MNVRELVTTLGWSVDEKGFKSYEKGMQKVKSTTEAVTNVVKNAIMLLGAYGLGRAVASAFDKASDLAEVMNVVDTTFEKSAKDVADWATTTLKSYGVAELEALRYVGFLGAQLKGANLSNEAFTEMAKNLTGLAGDMASFYNIAQEDAFAKIQAALMGNTRGLKELGIQMDDAALKEYAVSQGMSSNIQAMKAADKAMLRYNFIMAKTVDVQGDFSKSLATSFANNKRILSAGLVEMSVDLFKRAVPSGIKLIGVLNQVVNSMREWIKVNSDRIERFWVRVTNAIQLFVIKMHLLGLAIKNETNSMEGFKTLLNSLWNLLKAVFSIAEDGTSVLPKIVVALDKVAKILSKVIDFIAQNKEAVKTLLKYYLYWLGVAKLFNGYLSTAKGLERFIEQGAKVKDFLKKSGGLLSLLKSRFSNFIAVIAKHPLLFALVAVLVVAGLIILNFKEIKEWWDNLSDSAKLFIEVIGGITAIILGIVAALKIYTAVMAIVKGITLLWNVICAANPLVWIIGAIIVALIAVGVAIYEVIKHWEEIKEWLSDFWNWFTEGWKFAINQAVEFVMCLVNSIKTALTSVFDWFGDKWSLITDKVKSIKTFFGFDAKESVNRSTPQGAVAGIAKSTNTINNTNAGVENTINSKSNITVNVPAGTSSEQAQAIGRQVHEQMAYDFEELLSSTHSRIPATEAGGY